MKFIASHKGRLRARYAILKGTLSLFSFLSSASAQLVNDGDTRVLDSTTKVVASNLIIGTNGTGTLLRLQNGAVLSNLLDATIGLNGGANSNRVEVLGPNATWSAQNLLLIGGEGAFNSLFVTNGSRIQSGNVAISGGLDSAGNTATLAGVGSVWTNSQVLEVGFNSYQNRLEIMSGATLRNGLAIVGRTASGNSNTAIVSGVGSRWENTSVVRTGNGTGNHIIVSNGGFLSSAPASIIGTNSRGIITGAGSVWTNAGDFGIGTAGVSNHLVVADGGTLQTEYGYLGDGLSGGSNSLAIIEGAGSLWSNKFDLSLASTAGNELRIQNGGTAMTRTLYLGGFSGPDNRVTVSDVGSQLIVTGAVNVGNSGRNELLIITNGGKLVSDSGVIGNHQNSLSNQIVVTGTNSIWTNAGNISLNVGTESKLVVSKGAKVFCASATVNGSDSLALITGTASSWSIQGSLRTGEFTSGNQVIVSGGASLETGPAVIGHSYESNRVVITGSNSVWTSSAEITNGVMGLNNILSISSGAKVAAKALSIGHWQFADSNLVTVTDSNSILIASNGIVVGVRGRYNELAVSNGAKVVTSILGVGNGSLDPAPRYSKAIIAGAGTEMQCSTVNVGLQWTGITNQLAVQDGARLTATSPGATGLLSVAVGSALLNNGTITADSLSVTQVSAFFEFQAGTMNIRTSHVANGRTFVVGNGQTTSTLNLLGSSHHRFENGLVVVSNALLTGSGTILSATPAGTTNRGTIAPGNPLGFFALSNHLSLQPSSVIALDISGTVPTNRHDVITAAAPVALNGRLTLSLLYSFYPSSNDTFTLMTFPSATGAFTNFTSGQRLTTTDGLGSFVVTVSATNVVASDYLSPDTDNDGLSDYAEFLASLDSDADGQSDWAEHLAGTDPLSADSALRIISVMPELTGFRIQFQSVPGKDYLIHWTDNLSIWNTITNPTLTSPLPGLSEWLDDGSASGSLPSTNRSYRVGLELP